MTKIPPWNQLMLSGVDRPIVGRNKTNFTQGVLDVWKNNLVPRFSLSRSVGTGMREPWEGGWWKKRA